MFPCFLLMFAAISIIPALDTRSFGTAMGCVSLFVGALITLLCDWLGTANLFVTRLYFPSDRLCFPF